MRKKFLSMTAAALALFGGAGGGVSGRLQPAHPRPLRHKRLRRSPAVLAGP